MDVCLWILPMFYKQKILNGFVKLQENILRIRFSNMERKVSTTCLDTSAEFEVEPLILICEELFKAFSTFTMVSTPRLNETPPPLEPAYKGTAI